MTPMETTVGKVMNNKLFTDKQIFAIGGQERQRHGQQNPLLLVAMLLWWP